MGYLLAYSIISSTLLAAMYLIYKTLLSGEKQAGYNRGIIMLIYLVALTLPAVMLCPGIEPEATGLTATQPLFEIGRPTLTYSSEAGPGIIATLSKIIVAIYIAGVGVACGLTLITLRRILTLVRGGEHHSYGQKATIVVYDNRHIAPFSWQNYIVMSRTDYEENCRAILAHEMCHIESHHWIDLFVAQIVIIFQWFNPTAWLMRDELQLVHEYQADEAVFRSGSDIRQYQMLIIRKAVGDRFQSLANSLSHSNLKKRITMMYKSKSSTGGRMRALALVPAIVGALAIVATPAIASTLTTVSHTFAGDKVTENISNNETVSLSVSENRSETSDEKVYEAAEVPPTYPGGEAEMLMTLARNLKYPEKAYKEHVEGTVIVTFVVNAKGEIESPKVIRKVSPELDAEAIRALSSLAKFNPATIGGKPVSVNYTLPVRFKLNSGKDKETTDTTKAK